MTILRDCKMLFVRCNPDFPNATFNKDRPVWEVELRTSEPGQREEWKEAGLNVQLVTYRKGDEHEGEPILTDTGKKQWRAHLRKPAVNAKGEPTQAPEVVNGGKEAIDPDTVGNNSVGHVRVWTYESKKTPGKIVAVLDGIQVIKQVYRKPFDKTRKEDWAEEESVIIFEDEANAPPANPAIPAGTKVKAPAAPSPAPELEDDDVPF